jgi:hypothetical protein
MNDLFVRKTFAVTMAKTGAQKHVVAGGARVSSHGMIEFSVISKQEPELNHPFFWIAPGAWTICMEVPE